MLSRHVDRGADPGSRPDGARLMALMGWVVPEVPPHHESTGARDEQDEGFAVPGFKLLFSGLLASLAGDSLMLLMLAVWVKDLTGSSGAAGLTFFFLAIPAFIGPVLGLYVDRLRRRRC